MRVWKTGVRMRISCSCHASEITCLRTQGIPGSGTLHHSTSALKHKLSNTFLKRLGLWNLILWTIIDGTGDVVLLQSLQPTTKLTVRSKVWLLRILFSDCYWMQYFMVDYWYWSPILCVFQAFFFISKVLLTTMPQTLRWPSNLALCHQCFNNNHSGKGSTIIQRLQRCLLLLLLESLSLLKIM